MLAVVITLALAISYDAPATTRVPAPQAATEIGGRLLREPSVKSAIDRIKRDEPQMLEDQIRLCEIPSPPFKEARRAEAFRQALQALGLKNVRIDRAGNVLGERPGLAATSAPRLQRPPRYRFWRGSQRQGVAGRLDLKVPGSATIVAVSRYFLASSELWRTDTSRHPGRLHLWVRWGRKASATCEA